MLVHKRFAKPYNEPPDLQGFLTSTSEPIFFALRWELLLRLAITTAAYKPKRPMDSHELMKLLIPDQKVKSVSEFTGLTTSLLYMERRKAGSELTDTGSRNTIDRLDLFCEWNLDRNPELVRLVGERYLRMYHRHTSPADGNVTIYDLLNQLGLVSKECGEAIAALAGRKSVKDCEVEVAEARKALESALAMVISMEDDNA